MFDLIDQTIREYEFRRKIGSGGYGAVYQAYQPAVKRDVAIKVILPEYASRPEFIQRFEVEAQLVAQLEHPYIVPLYDYWQDDHGAFLVMRWLRGGSLRESLSQQGAWPVAHTSRLFSQIADALSFAHEAGVIHRDIKPGNILLDERGNAYLTDFGIAKQTTSDVHLTQSGATVGTLAYLSPEQIRSEPLTPASDIYSLGLVLYEMLAGEHPFPVSKATIILKHLNDPIPVVQDIRPDLPKAINEVVQQATAKDPDKRFPDALSLAAAFQASAHNAIEVSAETTAPDIPVRPQPTPTPSLPIRKTPANPQQRNRYYMLQNVRTFWIEGMLENSLHGQVLVDLDMQQQSGAVDHPWDVLLHTPGTDGQTLPPGTRIVEMHDRLNGKMLILGSPGSGKTTTLLELTRDLLYRAEVDDEHPIPVVLNLSSWTSSDLFAEWLVDELNTKYQVPKRVARDWVDHDHLTLLLDGLDEVPEVRRESCVSAINAYRETHGFVDVVVCSRTQDYDQLTNHLMLNGAIELKPLSDAQVTQYLARLGPPATAVSRLLDNDRALQEMGRSPLMLSIMILVYQDASAEELPQFDTLDSQREHLFTVYVKRMLERRIGEQPYSHETTRHHLAWLAHQMSAQGQTMFFIENLQPGFLTSYRQRLQYLCGIGFLTAGLVGPIMGLIFGLVGYGLVDNSIHLGLGATVSFGLLFGLFSMLFSSRYRISLTETFRWSWRRAALGSVIGAVAGFILSLSGGRASQVGMPLGLAGTGVLLGGLSTATVETKTQPNQGIRQSAQNALVAGIAVGLIIGAAFLIGSWLAYGLTDLVTRTVRATLALGLTIGLIVALIFGGLAVIQHIMLRLMLYRSGSAPLNLAKFLDHSCDLIFMRRIGGGFIFVHRYLADHFSSLWKGQESTR